MENNRIRNVAVIGAGGNVGSYITQALLNTKQHTITALTRADSKTTLPDGVLVKTIDYDKPETLVQALKGQDALVITLSGRSPMQELEAKLVRAAGEAGVSWILPNEWSPDSAHHGIVTDVFLFKMKVATRDLIEQIGQSSYVAVVTGFWYEYSLGMARNYGFDFANRTVTYYDDGDTKISTSTWPQIGRAVAAVLSLPVKHEDGTNHSTTLSDYRNKVVYVNSFTVSQKDMLASALRVTGTRESEWTIHQKPAREQYAIGMKEMQDKKPMSANFLYARVFYSGPDGGGDFEHAKGTSNERLGLPKEDIDEATKVAIERQREGAGH